MQSIDLLALIAQVSEQGPLWSHTAADFHINLLVWPAGRGVAEHVNSEVDVLLVGVAGTGAVLIDGQAHELAPGRLIVVPKGTRRAIESRSPSFAYLSVHTRRAGLRPTPISRPAGKPAASRTVPGPDLPTAEAG